MTTTQPLILDGGMGHLLAQRGASTHDDMWSARALLDDPDAVVRAHRDYLLAGASVIITNNYSTIPMYLDKADLADSYGKLTELAGRLAREAADAHDGVALVAGSLPPLSESYRPDLVPPPAEAAPIYAELVAALEPHVDLWICETMSTIAEARTTSAAVTDDRPLYVAYTLDEEPGRGLRSGESVTSAIEAFADRNIAGFLFNCTAGPAIEAAVTEARSVADVVVGGYPNRFDVPKDWTLDNDIPTEPRADRGTEYFVGWGLRMVDAGATIVGGCCGVGPDDITALVAALNERDAAL